MSDYFKNTIEHNDYIEQQLNVSNSPTFGDNGGQFLHQFSEAINDSNKLINEGYKLVTYNASLDRGVRFVLRKSK